VCIIRINPQIERELWEGGKEEGKGGERERERDSRSLAAVVDRKASPGSRGVAATPGRPHTCSGFSRR